MDVLNLSGTSTSLSDEECNAFHADATGAALNYKIIVRDGAVVAVLYQEDGLVRPSPFVEHRLPAAGSFVTLPDGELGRLGELPRGLIVAREPRDLPECAPVYAPLPGLRHKGKHPAELPGMVDLSVLCVEGVVTWPPREVSVPVCAITPADSSRLQRWHALWDVHVKERVDGAHEIAKHIEGMLETNKGAGATGERPAKEILRELTEAYGRLEERNAQLIELESPGIDDERLTSMQRGIQRFATLARFG